MDENGSREQPASGPSKEADLKRLLGKAAEDPEVLAVIQFGSTVLGKATAAAKR